MKDDLVNFIKNQLKKFQPRDDYAELFDIVLKFLGLEEAKKKKVWQLGACHKARWMAKIIYCLKIYIFRNEFK